MITIRLHAAESRDLVINLDDDRFKPDGKIVTVHATVKKEDLSLIREKLNQGSDLLKTPPDLCVSSTWIHQ